MSTVRKAVALVLLVSLLGFQENAYASIKSGDSCKKLGQVTSSGKLKFLCVASGKKLVWKTKKDILTPPPVIDLPGLLPEIASNYKSSTNSLTLEIANYTSDYLWKTSVKTGKSEIVGYGQILITGIESNNLVILTIETSRTGYMNSSKDFYFTPKLISETPIIDQAKVKSLNNGCEFELSNFNLMSDLNLVSTYGTVSNANLGVYRVEGLPKNTSATVSVINSKRDFLSSPYVSIICDPIPIYDDLTQRDWKLIAKDPDGNRNRYVHVFGKITQFDAATGTSRFRADVAGTLEEISATYFYGDNTFLSGSSILLRDFVAGDKFDAKVKIDGSYTYTNTLNGSISVPSLTVVSISRVR